MPYPHPTLTALRNQAVEDITTSGVPGLDGLLRNAVLRVLAFVIAGLAYSEYGHVDWVARQSVPFTATDEYLEAWAALIGVYRKDATAATGQAQFIGGIGGTVETVLPIDTPLMRYDGIPFTVTASGTVGDDGLVTVPIIAAVTGADTNADGPVPIAISAPVPGLNSNGTTLGVLAGGSDQELESDFRSRMLLKYANPPQGGSATDYELWALEVPGCTRAYVMRNGYGPGTVLIWPMFDDVRAANGGFPLGTDGVATDETRGTTASGDQLLVADHIWPVQPVPALVYVSAPIPYPIDVTLANLDPNTPEMVADIQASLLDLFREVAEVGGTIYPSQLYQAVLATPGIGVFDIQSPENPVQANAGSLPVLGTLTSV